MVTPKKSLQEAFDEFDQANPRVYQLIKKLAFQLIDSGKSHYGIGSIIEVLRWEINVKTVGDDMVHSRRKAEASTTTLAARARKAGIKRSTVLMRLRAGWSMEKALSTPVRGGK